MQISVLRLLPCLILLSSAIYARKGNYSASLESWAEKQYKFSVQHIFKAIHPKPDAYEGTIMASPTIIKPNPDYYYHWTRDASLTMDVVAALMENAQTEKERAGFYDLFDKYNNLTERLQGLPVPDALLKKKNFDKSQWFGEPKFNMDATPFTGDWGRPQNDGPASRAFAVTRYTKYRLHRYRDVSYLYNATVSTPLKRDLDYVQKHWRSPSFEIWEEVKGMHFYTLMVQRRAMLDGAALAERLKDKAAAARYRETADEISSEINKFWNPRKDYIVVTHDRVDGIDYKNTGLDSQVVLAALHASKNDGFYSPESDRILATWYALVKAFSRIYPDNRNHPEMAPAIGRYPEDQYNGYTSVARGGNGWMLITAGFGECVYRVKTHWSTAGEFRVTRNNVDFLRYVTGGHMRFEPGQHITERDERFNQVMHALVKTGDHFLARVRFHTERDGMHLSEQWNRINGTQQGAEDLTWSYTAFVSAYRAREQALI